MVGIKAAFAGYDSCKGDNMDQIIYFPIVNVHLPNYLSPKLNSFYTPSTVVQI